MRVKNFAGFMKSKTNKTRIFENEEGMDMGYYGANPEDEEAAMMDEEMPEDEMAAFRKMAGMPLWKQWVKENEGKIPAQELLRSLFFRRGSLSCFSKHRYCRWLTFRGVV